MDERLRPASLVNRIVLPHEDAEDFESRRQLYAIRSDFSGRPAQRRNARGINAKGVERKFTSAPRISLVVQSSSGESPSKRQVLSASQP